MLIVEKNRPFLLPETASLLQRGTENVGGGEGGDWRTTFIISG